MKQPDLCTCNNQLQPHDWMPGVCPTSEHVCGREPYLFQGECDACDRMVDQA